MGRERVGSALLVLRQSSRAARSIPTREGWTRKQPRSWPNRPRPRALWTIGTVHRPCGRSEPSTGLVDDRNRPPASWTIGTVHRPCGRSAAEYPGAAGRSEPSTGLVDDRPRNILGPLDDQNRPRALWTIGRGISGRLAEARSEARPTCFGQPRLRQTTSWTTSECAKYPQSCDLDNLDNLDDLRSMLRSNVCSSD
jgi:hypothetical protein